MGDEKETTTEKETEVKENGDEKTTETTETTETEDK